MKLWLLLLALSISLFDISILNAQSVRLNKVEEHDKNLSYPIDVRHFLGKKDKIIANYLSEHPNYFESQKLQKTNAWNFSVGSTKSWYAEDLTTPDGTYSVPSTCRAVGTNCYIFVEDAIWNTQVSLANVNAVMEAFDNSTPANNTKGIYETVVETFGNPPDVDNDSRIIILILDIIDGYDGSGGYVAGYFYGLNELSISGSNVAEIYYVDANPTDLSTEYGLNTALNTTAHEFQHMIHFNYHDGSPSKPFQATFLNEGCSEISSVVCGYPLRDQSLYNNEYNHFLLDWREGDDVLNDYARAARYIVYFYDQFGPDFLKRLVQSKKTHIPSIDDALSTVSPSTTLRFSQTLENWLIANTVNNTNVNPAWSYTTPNVNTVNAFNISNPNYSSEEIRVEKAAADYIKYSNGKNLSISFNDFGFGKLKFIALKYNINNSIEVEDLSANSNYTFSDFGTIYESITFAILNLDGYVSYNYSFTSSGDIVENKITLAYDENPPTGILSLENNDTVCVFFDGVLGGSLDSIKVALRQAGSVYGSICEYSGTQRPSPLGKVLLPNLTVTSNIADRPVYNTVTESYPVPFPNWIKVDLTSQHIDASKSFVAAFVVEGTYPENNRIMITEQPNANNHSYTFFTPTGSETPDWFNVTSSETTIYAYLIRAYVSFEVTDIEEQEIETIPKEFSVEQNYPNPFNPTTNIDFSIPKPSHVKLTVYNNMGELVKTIVNKEIRAGKHSLNFEGANLASGIYYYKLISGSFVETKKMILMK
jgi:Secretion system C-terminal sorting domain